MKRIVHLLIAVMICSCSNDSKPIERRSQNDSLIDPATTEPTLFTSTIDADLLEKNIPIYAKKALKSGNGRRKTLWKIQNNELGNFEIIGDNQRDADQIAWQVPDFDDQGNQLTPSNSPATKAFFELVISQYITNAREITEGIFAELSKAGDTTVTRVVGDLSFETDGTYSFIRHESRRFSR